MQTKELNELFSEDRLKAYASDDEHRANLLLIGELAPKLGIIEIITRNKTTQILGDMDSIFISRQTFGYWCRVIDQNKIHNDLLDLRGLNLSKYSKFNRQSKSTMLNYKKVKICYSLLLTIRNRALHWENLYKLNTDGTPRISTNLDGIVVGVDPESLKLFIDDILCCFNEDLKGYLE